MSDSNQQILDELKGWGGGPEMSAFEAVMWRAESDPRLRSTTTSVFMLDRVPDWGRLYAGHQWLMRAVPRFRQRVLDPAVGMPVWIEDGNFDLDYHLRRVSLPAPGTERQLFDYAQNQATIPFDRVRPPWEGTLIEGVEGARAAYVLKLHHALSDGLGIIQLLSRVFGRDRELSHRPMPKPDFPMVLGRTSGSGRSLKSLFGLPQQTANTLGNLFGSAKRFLNDPAALQETLDYLKSAQRVLAMKPVSGSPILKRRSLSWRFDGIEIPLPELKAAARACEGSLNDVFLAGLVGGFRRYHETMGVHLKQIPIGFPISLRKEGDPMGGNKFAGLQYSGPLDELDPIARVRHVQAFVTKSRKETALDVMIHLMPLMLRIPNKTMTAMMVSVTTSQDAQVSNIPGISEPVYMADAQVTHLWPFAPVPGCPMMISLVSHNGRCCIGINSDRAAVIEPELLVECLREGLQEMLALGAPPAAVGRKQAAHTTTAAKRRNRGKSARAAETQAGGGNGAVPAVHRKPKRAPTKATA